MALVYCSGLGFSLELGLGLGSDLGCGGGGGMRILCPRLLRSFRAAHRPHALIARGDNIVERHNGIASVKRVDVPAAVG